MNPFTWNDRANEEEGSAEVKGEMPNHSLCWFCVCARVSVWMCVSLKAAAELLLCGKERKKEKNDDVKMGAKSDYKKKDVRKGQGLPTVGQHCVPQASVKPHTDSLSQPTAWQNARRLSPTSSALSLSIICCLSIGLMCNGGSQVSHCWATTTL